MRENYTIKKCSSCAAKKSKIRVNKKAGLFTGFLLVLLPKCPLCVIAYSSTMMLCGKDEFIISSQIHSSLLATVLTLILCMVFLASLFLNYRNNRTKYALALAFSGTALILASTVWDIGPGIYYTGTGVVFMGVWLNGSMLFVLNKVKTMMHKLYAINIRPLSET
jgi:hypothetical protein